MPPPIVGLLTTMAVLLSGCAENAAQPRPTSVTAETLAGRVYILHGVKEAALPVTHTRSESDGCMVSFTAARLEFALGTPPVAWALQLQGTEDCRFTWWQGGQLHPYGMTLYGELEPGTGGDTAPLVMQSVFGHHAVALADGGEMLELSVPADSVMLRRPLTLQFRRAS
jgi:hypothetical protein